MEGNQRSQPGGTPAFRASSSMSPICFLLVVNFTLDALELGQRLLALVRDLRALDGIVARGEIGRERVDAALERLGKHFVPPQLVARLSNPATPRFFVLRVGRTRRLFGRRRLSVLRRVSRRLRRGASA